MIHKGSLVTCIWNGGIQHHLTQGKQYIALEDTEPGIFSSRPFLTVVSDNGEKYTSWESRFDLVSRFPGVQKVPIVEFNILLDGGYILVENPYRYHPKVLITDGERCCVWHREVL